MASPDRDKFTETGEGLIVDGVRQVRDPETGLIGPEHPSDVTDRRP